MINSVQHIINVPLLFAKYEKVNFYFFIVRNIHRKYGPRVNTEKSKYMRRRKSGGKWRKIIILWKVKFIEKVKEFNCLGYTLQRNKENEAHIKNFKKKSMIPMEKVLEKPGKRKCTYSTYWLKALSCLSRNLGLDEIQRIRVTTWNVYKVDTKTRQHDN